MPARRLRDGQEAFKSIPKRPKSTPKAPRRRPRGRPNHVPGTLSGNMIPHSRPGKGYRHFKMARDGPKMVQDVKGGTRAPKMAQDSCQDASTRPQDRPKAVPSDYGVSRGNSRDARIAQQPEENRILPSRRFARSLRVTSGTRQTAHCPREPQEEPKTAPGSRRERPIAPETAPREPQESPRRPREVPRPPRKALDG